MLLLWPALVVMKVGDGLDYHFTAPFMLLGLLTMVSTGFLFMTYLRAPGNGEERDPVSPFLTFVYHGVLGFFLLHWLGGK